MAVVKVKEVWTGRTGAFSSDWNRSFTRTFRVETDNTADGAIIVGFAPGIPRMWDFYVSHETGEVDTLARCRSVKPMQDAGNPYLWEVTCDYDTKSTDPAGSSGSGAAGQPGGGGGADNPEQRPWQIEWDFEQYTAPLRYDMKFPEDATPIFNRAITNSAGDQYDPLPEYSTGHPVLSITRLELSHDPTLAAKYAFTLNSDPYLFAQPGQAQLLPVQARVVWIGGYPLWEKTYRIRFKCEPDRFEEPAGGVGPPSPEPATWQPRILDAGFREKASGGGEPREILSKYTMQPVQHPVPLDGAGNRLDQASIDAGFFAWRTCNAYRLLPFAPLNLAF